MRQLTAKNIPTGFTWAAVEKNGSAYAYKGKPPILKNEYLGFGEWHNGDDYIFLGGGWDASDWRNSIVSKDSPAIEPTKPTAQKDQANKPSFAEIDPEFLLAMAERMTANKGKYEPFNWQKPCDINLLLDAAQRHLLALRMPEQEGAEETQLDHAVALALNAMIIHYQLKHNKQ